ncbi:Uma2 family endonuclease [Gemmata sp. G18]|uniref:Uma2 family endonuclease n=1 Tax=Gemmata palustris TaxID=2822762 RepID=A0ABS5C3P1_9BACT|nr:Uma2 family endonuclease [Gemmata palustris]MBP3960513.1 Uma2 family endonuclease [Gemmata palustris]
MSTAEVLMPLPKLVRDAFEDRDHYEIVDGVHVELPPMSVDSQVLASRLLRHLSNYGVAQDLGEAYAEVLFKSPSKKDRNRRPDVAFVSYTRWSKYQPMPDTNAWDVLPDLCVEVVSPNDTGDEIETKVDEYLQAGVTLVWVVYPRQERFYVYESASRVRRLTRVDTLDGGPVLPGFALPLSELFLQPPTPPVNPPVQP